VGHILKLRYVLLIFLTFQVNAEAIRIGLIEAKPWAYYDEAGLIAGVYPSVFKKIQQDTGVNLELKLYPFARVKNELRRERGLVDLSIFSFKKKRTLYFKQIIPLFEMDFVILSHKNSTINTIEDIQGKQIGLIAGGSGCPCIDGITYNKVYLSDHKYGLRMLANRRIDGQAGPSIRLIQAMHDIDYKEPYKAIVYEKRQVWLWARKNLMDESDGVLKIKEYMQDYFSKNSHLKLLEQEFGSGWDRFIR